jgi:two-component system, OmpR family, phosphate regulon sensor histidine kinase PhoR
MEWRVWGALALVAAAAAGGWLLGAPLQAAAVVGVAGVAAVLLAGAEPSEVEPEPPAGDGSAPLAPADLLDVLALPVMLVADGRVRLANRAARALLGQHIIGEDARVALRHPAAAARLAQDGETGDAPVELDGLGTPDGRWQMHVAATPAGERIVSLVDLTGLHAAEKMRVDFVANASHELRTPLASILGFIETLRDEAGESPALRERFLGVMFDEARRMQRLVEDLISLSRIEAVKYRAPSDPIDMAELVGEVCAELRSAASARADDLRCQAEDGLPPVAGDRAQLSQMLHNLIGNAMKYGRPGTPVGTTLAPDGRGGVRLEVSDEGEGIPPEHIPRLTERFYRVDSGRSRALGGTGLGLAIVKHIVERHRGRLEIVSRLGRGTTVAVTLPPMPAAAVIKS